MPPEILIVDERYDVAPGSRLEIDGPFALLHIEPAEDARVAVRVALLGGASADDAQALARRANLRVRRSGGVIRVEAGAGPLHLAEDSVLSWPLLRVALALPPALHVDVRTIATEVVARDVDGGFTIAARAGSVRLDRMRGELHVEACHSPLIVRDFEGAGVTLRCAGTALQAANLRAARVVVEMAAGWAHLSALSGSIALSVSGGTTEVKRVRGPMVAEVVGGRLTVQIAGIDETELRCRGGRLDVSLPEAAAARLALSGRTLHLDERLAFTGDHGDGVLAGRLGEGGPEIKGTVAAGSLRFLSPE